jgi:diguanylate cyclase (GGDEF)-like protein
MNLNSKELNELVQAARLQFIKELGGKVGTLQTILLDPNLQFSSKLQQEILRICHSLHGTSATLGFENISRLSKEMEESFQGALKSGMKLDEGVIGEIAQRLESILQEQGHLIASQHPKQSSNSLKEYTNLPDSGTVLLIDDDLVILKLLEASLVAEGYTVYICVDSITAMDILAVCKPDIILLDIMMPQWDGYELLEKIKATPEYTDICVIFLSGLDDIEDKIRGMKAGIDDYITKPFDVRELLTRVEMVLRRSNKYREKLLKDALTGAYSRYYLYERLKDELERFNRSNVIFSLAFLDIDYFKKVNDSYGHPTGDYVLRHFTSFLIENMRESDCIFRYGGEEFVILLPDANEEQAFVALDRLRQVYSDQVLEYGGNAFSVSFSCGVKEMSCADKSISQLISMSDEAMYVAKNTGRNKVIKYSNIQDQTSRKKSLLVVDDENTIIKLLSERLTESGYRIIVAQDGQEAIKRAAEEYIDGVVLDLILPDMDGLEVCKKIKACSLSKDTRIIILSKKSEEHDIIKGLNYGADDYVTKPFSMAELEARIMRVLSR